MKPHGPSHAALKDCGLGGPANFMLDFICLEIGHSNHHGFVDRLSAKEQSLLFVGKSQQIGRDPGHTGLNPVQVSMSGKAEGTFAISFKIGQRRVAEHKQSIT